MHGLRDAPQERDGHLMDRFGKREGVTKAAAVMLLAVALMLGGCMNRRGDIPYAPASFDRAPDSVFASETEYRLGPSDVVSVAVYRAPEPLLNTGVVLQCRDAVFVVV